MKTYYLLTEWSIEPFKVNNPLWEKLHKDRNGYISYALKDKIKEVLEKYNLPATIFNLNCLEQLGGVILTLEEVENKKLLEKLGSRK